MSNRTPYSYTVLRYVHDITSGEFVNVGVVVSSPDAGFVAAKFRSASSRVKSVFPTLNANAFRARVLKLQAKFDSLQEQGEGQLRLDSGRKLSEIVQAVLPKDDSALQWSPIGSGLSKDLQKTLISLYERLVTKYDQTTHSGKREDADVWREFKTALEKRNLAKHLTSKTIEVEDDGVVFEHAWKNGAWHCYEPLSFDLANSGSIKSKAHRWLGQLASLQDAKEDFSVYFLVGKPSEPELKSSYEKALSILRKGRSVHVIEENEIPQFSERVAEAMRDHDAHEHLSNN